MYVYLSYFKLCLSDPIELKVEGLSLMTSSCKDLMIRKFEYEKSNRFLRFSNNFKRRNLANSKKNINMFNHQLFSHFCGKLLKRIHTDLNKQIRNIFQVIIKSFTTTNYISVVCKASSISYTIYVLIIRHFKFSVSRVIFLVACFK